MVHPPGVTSMCLSPLLSLEIKVNGLVSDEPGSNGGSLRMLSLNPWWKLFGLLLWVTEGNDVWFESVRNGHCASFWLSLKTGFSGSGFPIGTVIPQWVSKGKPTAAHGLFSPRASSHLPWIHRGAD